MTEVIVIRTLAKPDSSPLRGRFAVSNAARLIRHAVSIAVLNGFVCKPRQNLLIYI